MGITPLMSSYPPDALALLLEDKEHGKERVIVDPLQYSFFSNIVL